MAGADDGWRTGVIELTEASYGYGDRTLLRDMTLTLEAGSFHFLTGPSGAGKTTFLRMCYMELRPDHGRMALFGQDVTGADRGTVARMRRRIGVVHQDCQFLDHLSVARNVSLPLIVAGRDPDEGRDDMQALLAWVGLTGREGALPPELSGGERQRAALARAVMLSPDLILADEPTGNVDEEMSARILSLLVQLNAMGKTVVVATHDLGLIRRARSEVTARVLRLRDGAMTVGAEL